MGIVCVLMIAIFVTVKSIAKEIQLKECQNITNATVQNGFFGDLWIFMRKEI